MRSLRLLNPGSKTSPVFTMCFFRGRPIEVSSKLQLLFLVLTARPFPSDVSEQVGFFASWISEQTKRQDPFGRFLVLTRHSEVPTRVPGWSALKSGGQPFSLSSAAWFRFVVHWTLVNESP